MAELTDADYQQRAEKMWDAMSDSERHLIGLGLFPFASMDLAKSEGYDEHKLTVALLNLSETRPSRPKPIKRKFRRKK